jgi:hypothetical protein
MVCFNRLQTSKVFTADQDGSQASSYMLVSFRAMTYVQACIELALMHQVSCLSTYHFLLHIDPDLYLLLGSEAGIIQALSNISTRPPTQLGEHEFIKAYPTLAYFPRSKISCTCRVQ